MTDREVFSPKSRSIASRWAREIAEKDRQIAELKYEIDRLKRREQQIKDNASRALQEEVLRANKAMKLSKA
jgi:hypothetical protein